MSARCFGKLSSSKVLDRSTPADRTSSCLNGLPSCSIEDGVGNHSLESVVARLNRASGFRVGGQTTEDELALLLVLGESLLRLYVSKAAELPLRREQLLDHSGVVQFIVAGVRGTSLPRNVLDQKDPAVVTNIRPRRFNHSRSQGWHAFRANSQSHRPRSPPAGVRR